MLVNMHNHTTRCNHATGSMEEFVKKAIKSNISYFGFSDHAPMKFNYEYRMGVKECDDYEKETLFLQKKYKDKINILLSYEIDYLDKYSKAYFEQRVLSANVDYFIGSVHFIKEWGFDNPEYIKEYKNKNIDNIWQDYFDAIESMANSQLFDVVGHLDLIKVFKYMPKKDIRTIAKKAILAIKKNNMVVEINSSGFRKPAQEQYPSVTLLQMCYENNIPITLSSDSHKIQDIDDGLQKVHNIASSIGYSKITVFKNRQKKYINLHQK